MFFDVFLDFLRCKVVVGLQSTDVLARNASYFVVAQFVVVAQVEGDTLLRRQREQSLLEELLRAVAIGGCLGLQAIGESRSQGIDALEDAGLPAQVVQSLVGGDAVHPSCQRAFTLEGLDAAEYLDARLLQHVLSVIVTYHDAADVPVELLAILLHEQSEAPLALIGSGQHLQQLFLS